MTLSLIGQSFLTTADPAVFSANKPSFYADPVAWAVTVAIERAIDGASEEIITAADEVGVIVTSSALALPTARRIAQDIRHGRVSPLRFAGANPGILAGLSCIRWHFRGPSLVLAGAGPEAVSAALAVAQTWLEHRQASYIVCVGHHEDGGTHAVRCAIVSFADSNRPADDVFRLLTGQPEAQER